MVKAKAKGIIEMRVSQNPGSMATMYHAVGKSLKSIIMNTVNADNRAGNATRGNFGLAIASMHPMIVTICV